MSVRLSTDIVQKHQKNDKKNVLFFGATFLLKNNTIRKTKNIIYIIADEY